MLPDSALDQRTILGLRGKLKQIYYLTPLCLTEETITGHFMCYVSFFLTIKRDPENSVSVHGHKDGSFAESKIQTQDVLILSLCSSQWPGHLRAESPRLQELNMSFTGGCWTLSQKLQPLTSKSVFRRVSTTSLCGRNLQHSSESSQVPCL